MSSTFYDLQPILVTDDNWWYFLQPLLNFFLKIINIPKIKVSSCAGTFYHLLFIVADI